MKVGDGFVLHFGESVNLLDLFAHGRSLHLHRARSWRICSRCTAVQRVEYNRKWMYK